MHQTMRFALDRASVRSIDPNGYLHVQSSVVSRACVSEYLGYEVVGHEQLGLNPQQTYSLLRPADELAKAAPSLNGVPLLSEHQPQYSEAMNDRLTVGSVADAAFDARTGELKASLTVWKQNEIDQIQGGKVGLSCGYSYRAVPEAGRFDGQPYTLKMVDLKFNHLAICPEPRIPGAVIGDSKPRFISQRKNLIVMDENDNDVIDPRDDLQTQVCKFLGDKISPEDMATIETLFSNASPGQAMDARHRVAQASAAAKSYTDRFPNAGRIKQGFR